MAKQKRSAVSGVAERSTALDLRACRQRKGVTLEEIAERTKISIRFLRAIEAEEFEQLPGGIFATSYLRQYAAHVGVKEADLLACYQRKVEDSTAKPCEVVSQSGRGSAKSTLIRMWWASLANGR